MMSFRVCPNCGNKNSDNEKFCDNCGIKFGTNKNDKTNRNFIIVWGCIGILFLFYLIYMPNTSPNNSTSSADSIDSSKIYQEGDTLKVGYTTYAVWDSWWSKRLSDNKYANEPPDAMYLFVELTVRNDDNEARSIPPFKLIDERGAEYERSDRSWAIDDAIGVLDSLNPGVKKQGVVVFDVPKSHDYKLRVSGGFWSAKEAFIELSPVKVVVY